jgi:hypothetical protein
VVSHPVAGQWRTDDFSSEGGIARERVGRCCDDVIHLLHRLRPWWHYLIVKAAQGPIMVAGPPPANPAAEAGFVKGYGNKKRTPLTRKPNTGTTVITKTGNALTLQSAAVRKQTSRSNVAPFPFATIDDIPRRPGNSEVGRMMLVSAMLPPESHHMH